MGICYWSILQFFKSKCVPVPTAEESMYSSRSWCPPLSCFRTCHQNPFFQHWVKWDFFYLFNTKKVSMELEYRIQFHLKEDLSNKSSITASFSHCLPSNVLLMTGELLWVTCSTCLTVADCSLSKFCSVISLNFSRTVGFNVEWWIFIYLFISRIPPTLGNKTAVQAEILFVWLSHSLQVRRHFATFELNLWRKSNGNLGAWIFFSVTF